MKYFTKNHEWVKIEATTALIGISQHAADELGDITYVELPELIKLNQNDVLTTIESVKAASDIYAPITGTVTKFNEQLEDSPEVINNSAEEDGWICQLSDINPDDIKTLMNEEEYKRFIKC